MRRGPRIIGVAAASAALVASVAACATQAEPDEIGLYYTKGRIEGTHFQECIEPSTKGPGTINDKVYWLPTSLRTWNIQPSGGDTDQPIVAGTKPDDKGQAGPQVVVYATVEFYLNTDCGDGKDKNSPVVQFWEKTGRRYNATTKNPEGWKTMLLNTLVPVLQRTVQGVTRDMTADELDADINGAWAKAEALMRDEFTAQLRAKVGGDYFCGPEYRRGQEVTWEQRNPDGSVVEKHGVCPPVKVTITDINYADKGLQDARAAVRKAAEDAKRKLIEAQSQVDQSRLLSQAAKDPAYMRLKEIEAQLQAAQACAANPNCTLIIGDGSGVNVNAGKK
jgi:hypothetical protein